MFKYTIINKIYLFNKISISIYTFLHRLSIMCLLTEMNDQLLYIFNTSEIFNTFNDMQKAHSAFHYLDNLLLCHLRW